MEGIVLDVSALRRHYRDRITQLSNTAVHRKNVDDGVLAEPCYICLGDLEIGEEVTTLRCECPSWAHEACLAKFVFETGGCPTCRKPIYLIDDEVVLAQAAADGDTEEVRRLLERGIQHSPQGTFDSTALLRAAQHGHREIIRLLLEHGASISEQDRNQQWRKGMEKGPVMDEPRTHSKNSANSQMPALLTKISSLPVPPFSIADSASFLPVSGSPTSPLIRYSCAASPI
jgi:hypothetical protein